MKTKQPSHVMAGEAAGLQGGLAGPGLWHLLPEETIAALSAFLSKGQHCSQLLGFRPTREGIRRLPVQAAGQVPIFSTVTCAPALASCPTRHTHTRTSVHTHALGMHIVLISE